MSQPNRNLQAKYLKSRRQAREAAHIEFSKSGYVTAKVIDLADNETFRPSRETVVKPWFKKDGKRKPWVQARPQRKLSIAQGAWVDCGTVLLRNGVPVTA